MTENDEEREKDKKFLESELQKAIARSGTVSQLYEKLYEDNVIGKVSDEWFVELSHKYEKERMDLKAKNCGYSTQNRRVEKQQFGI